MPATKPQTQDKDNSTDTSVPNVGPQVARGFVWNIIQSFLERGLTALGQLILARLLEKHDFGLIALTYTVTTFAALLQQSGIKQALLQRSAEFSRWATPAHWMSSSLGVCAAVVTLLSAPHAASYYGEPRLSGLLLVAALGFPIAAFATVPEARLTAELRFRFLAHLAIAASVLTFALTILLAKLFSLGPYSILLPPVVIGALRLPVIWFASHTRIKFNLCIRDWPPLLSTSATLLGANLALVGTYVGPMSILERLTGRTDLVGVFYFMHQLSDQAVRLLVANLAAVMLPALALFQSDPARQTVSFERAVRAILLVGVPVCVLQAVLSGPLVRLILPEKFHSSSWLLSLLSIYMLGRLVLPLVETMLVAQRRQHVWLWICLVYLPTFLVSCLVGIMAFSGSSTWRIGYSLVAFGPAERCALGMTVTLATVIPLALASCFPDSDSPLARGWSILRFSILSGAISACAGATLVSLLPATTAADAIALLTAPIAVFAPHFLLCRKFAYNEFADLFARVRAICPRWLIGALPRANVSD